MKKKLPEFSTAFGTYRAVQILGEGGSGIVFACDGEDGNHFLGRNSLLGAERAERRCGGGQESGNGNEFHGAVCRFKIMRSFTDCSGAKGFLTPSCVVGILLCWRVGMTPSSLLARWSDSVPFDTSARKTVVQFTGE